MENTQQEQIKDMCIEVANIVIKHLPLTYHLRYGKTIDEIKSEFYTTIEDRMKADRMKAKITSTINITPSEVKAFYNNLPKDSLPLIGSKVEVSHITKIAKISEKIKKETKEKLNKYRTAIIKGERTFASTAVFYSMDPGTKSEGGEFDWVTRGTFVPEFDRIAFTMAVGSVSEVFETDYGFHILELFERRGNNEYRGRHILLMPKVSADELAKSKKFLDSVYTLIENGVYTFEEAAKIFSDDKETKNSGGLIYNQQTASSFFEIKDLDKQLFMVVDGLKVGEYSKPVFGESRDGKYYQLVKLKTQSKPHQANLKQDYQLITQFATNSAKSGAIIGLYGNRFCTFIGPFACYGDISRPVSLSHNVADSDVDESGNGGGIYASGASTVINSNNLSTISSEITLALGFVSWAGIFKREQKLNSITPSSVRKSAYELNDETRLR